MKSTRTECFAATDWIRCCALMLAWVVAAGTLNTALGESNEAEKSDGQLAEPTHFQTRTIQPMIDGKPVKLHSLTTTGDGSLLVAVGGHSSSFEMTATGMKTKITQQPAAVLMLGSDGEQLKRWDLDITPSALAVAPDGTIYVGGSGKVQRLASNGQVETTASSPHVSDANAEESGKRTGAAPGPEKQLDTLRERVATIKEKAEEDRSKLEEAQLKAFERQIEALENLLGVVSGDDQEADGQEIPSAMELRKNLVTSMAASNDHVFICATEPSGRGYSVWRMDSDLNEETAEVILEGLRGCCGQMDVQCCGDKLLVSENTSFKVGIYDHFGRRQGSFGKRDRTSRAGFGSCCNPMNSFGMSDGTVLTAESSIGHIKRFDTDGKLVSYIGKASIGGGCKHCSLGYDPNQDIYYMMYEDKSSICVLEKSTAELVAAAEKRKADIAGQVLPLLAGTWKQKQDKKNSSPADAFSGPPVTGLSIGKDGEVKVTDGMYAQVGGDMELEFLPSEKSAPANSCVVALVNDQARMFEMTWCFSDISNAKVDFGYGMSLEMERTSPAPTSVTLDSALAGCGAGCSSEGCDKPSSSAGTTEIAATTIMPPATVLNAKTVTLRSDSGLLGTIQLPPSVPSQRVVLPSISAAPTQVEYKLVGKKKLGLDPEAKLNQLGADGWDYCGMLGNKMMFKRSKIATTSVPQRVAETATSER